MVEALATNPVNDLPMIRDLPDEERPRERLLKNGAGALSNAELLAILLRTGIRGESVLNLSQRLISKFKGLRGIASSVYGEYADVKGISAVKYCELMAALELGKRLASSTSEDRLIIRSPKDVAAMLMPEMADLTQEHLKVVLLTTKNHVASVHEVYVGTVNTSLVRAAEVFQHAIRENLPAIVLVHNHPSGDPNPSTQDIDLTKQLHEAGKLLNIELTDHIIVARDGWRSLRELRAGLG